MSYKVLIVDDSKLARMAVAKALHALQPEWTRIEAANAEEAMDHMQQSSVNLALLDFNMPGRDGLTLATELRALNPDMPIALVSANHQEEIVVKAQQAGAIFLAKPLTQQALAQFFEVAIVQLKTSGR
jgi:DNA-binding NarL/FixJ family response regulator